MNNTGGAASDIGRRERKKDITRRAIRSCAVELFLRQGFTDTTVEQISDAAEVAPRTFFRYFRTKEATLFSLESFEEIIAGYRSAPPELDPLTALMGVVTQFDARELSPETVVRRNLRTSLLVVPAVSRYASEIADEATERMRDATKCRLDVVESVFDHRAEVMAGFFRSIIITHFFRTNPAGAHAESWLGAMTELVDLARHTNSSG
ncbi:MULTISPECIES: TetR/AcrR family transcriptional regulator [Rhodococcus]|uniref:TetR/AcrR family transcriptional regulator n=1 Tax=Rhodococcus TaxID=1827 RepID=UPI001562492B|nr:MULTISPECIES: TetR family transcriptional regulator [Rhodococcus]NRI65445.1 TetR family transcriptional regulator [Rhodococcus sp. MS16]QXW01379.1 TetR family transcriptional regulator [Rhodococcus globerulus]